MKLKATVLCLIAVIAAQVVTLPNCSQPCIISSMVLSSCASNDARCLCQDQNYITAVARCIVPACSTADQDAAARYVSSTLCQPALGSNNLAQIQQAISVARVQQGAQNQAATAVGNQPVLATTVTGVMSSASASRVASSGRAVAASASSSATRAVTSMRASMSASATTRPARNAAIMQRISAWLLAVPVMLIAL